MKNFTRKQLFERLQSKQNLESQDLLDEKALEGYQYLSEDEEASTILNRLDDRFESLLDKHKQNTPPARTKVFNLGILKRLAAAVLILLIPAYFLLKGPSDQRLYTAYFDAPISTYYSANRGTNTSGDQALENAFKLYESMLYEKASLAISELVESHPEKEDLVFYQGIALLETGDTEAAISKLTQCLETTYNRVDQLAPWYLALAYIKIGDREAAKDLLNNLVRSDSAKSDQAKQLLKKLQ